MARSGSVCARRITKNVWYRASVGSTIEDRGTVTVQDGTFEFTGKKQAISGRIRSVERRPMGFKTWVHVGQGLQIESAAPSPAPEPTGAAPPVSASDSQRSSNA